jgi:hypothetical protein
MMLKHKKFTPQEYIGLGIVFFLLGLFLSMFTDGRMIEVIITGLIHNNASVDFIQGIATGLLIPLSGASIFFNIRGLCLIRCQK